MHIFILPISLVLLDSFGAFQFIAANVNLEFQTVLTVQLPRCFRLLMFHCYCK